VGKKESRQLSVKAKKGPEGAVIPAGEKSIRQNKKTADTVENSSEPFCRVERGEGGQQRGRDSSMRGKSDRRENKTAKKGVMHVSASFGLVPLSACRRNDKSLRQ